jgi:hypothetical protein
MAGQPGKREMAWAEYSLLTAAAMYKKLTTKEKFIEMAGAVWDNSTELGVKFVKGENFNLETLDNPA